MARTMNGPALLTTGPSFFTAKFLTNRLFIKGRFNSSDSCFADQVSLGQAGLFGNVAQGADPGSIHVQRTANSELIGAESVHGFHGAKRWAAWRQTVFLH